MIKKNNEEQYLINRKIRNSVIRITGDPNFTQEISRDIALSIANELGMDLVLLTTNQEGVGICRIVDYQKFIYDKKKKDKEQKKKQKLKQSEIKEIRMTPNTDDHDFNFKLVHAKKFLADNDKVLVSVFFKGREITFKEQGEIILLRFANELIEVGIPEYLPKMEGKRMSMMIKPLKK